MRLEALSEERYLKKEGHMQEEVEVRVDDIPQFMVTDIQQAARTSQVTC